MAALLPALVLGVYVWRQDTQPEPIFQLVKAVLFGVGICIPVALLESVISGLLFPSGYETWLGAAEEAFLVAALPEEGFKLLALWIVLRKNPYFDEHFDGIIYAVCVGLGFAAVENVSYLFSNLEIWQSVAISRALLAVPGHYAFAVLMGYYYSLYHFTQKSFRNAACILLVPVLAHGIYDTLALSGRIHPYIGGVGFLLLVLFCFRMHKFARRKMLAQISKDRMEAFEKMVRDC